MAPISAVVPSAESASLAPKAPAPISPAPVSFGPCCVHVAPARANTHAAPVDLVFDTVGGELLASSAALVRDGGKVVSIAEEAPGADYFVVEPNREELVELAQLADAGELRPTIDSVFALEDARAAFERVQSRGKRGKVVLRVQ